MIEPIDRIRYCRFTNAGLNTVRRIFSLLLSVAFGLTLYASGPECADSVSGNGGIVSRLMLNLRGGYVFSSYKDDLLGPALDESEAKTSHGAGSVHLAYAFGFRPGTVKGDFYPGVYQGIGVSVSTFGNPDGIGTPVAVYALQGAPVWRISDRLTLGYEWNFGASFGWKPCDGHTASSNLVVGSRVNAYINLGLKLDWRVGRNWLLEGGIDLTHYSNGNTAYPNPGVNSGDLRIGVAYLFGDQPTRPSWRGDTVRPAHRVSYDVTAYGAWRKRVYRGLDTPVLLRGHYAIAGIGFAPMYEVCRIFRAGASRDLQWDQSSNLKKYYGYGTTTDDIRFDKPDFLGQVCVGLAARAELVMPYFSVNVGIGCNVVGPFETHGTYEAFNLKTYITPGLFINIGYQLLNFQTQNNLMLGIGYTFNSNRRR